MIFRPVFMTDWNQLAIAPVQRRAARSDPTDQT